ncbi:hypothetical protein FHY35_003151 [Xanthomonas arboricola]|nr:hypothetical protein [Xanthomonas arboricola]
MQGTSYPWICCAFNYPILAQESDMSLIKSAGTD